MASPQPAVFYEEMNPQELALEAQAQEILQKLESLELPYEDGIPMETNWHRLQMNLLIEIVEQYWKDRTDFFVGGNMFIYFSLDQVKNRDYRGPDFFVVKDTVWNPDRKSWIVWEEQGRYPDVIVELASPSTIKMDMEFKKKLYERTFNTAEYFCYDPETKTLHGWRLEQQKYHPIPPDADGRLECRELGLWLGHWEGAHLRLHTTWLRFYTQDGLLVPKFEELAIQQAEALTQQAEVLTQQAEVLTQQAEVLAQQLKTEANRAHAAEEELKRLKALLAEKNMER